MIYFTADTHFGHENVIRFCGRPYTTAAEMDEALVENWNSRVKGNDTVFILGDLFFRSGNAEEILRRLKGKKRLLVGNHDGSWMTKVDVSRYFASVDLMLELSDGRHALTLCHYPLLTWKHAKKSYMIHGHIHNQRNHAYEILKTLPRVLNAGVDINFYRPVPLDELVENNRKYYSEEYPELFPVPPRPDRSAPGLMPRKPDFRPLPQRH